MFEKVEILACARKHGLTDSDILKAMREYPNPIAAQHRNYEIPAHIALAGTDTRGRYVEVLAAEQEDGTWVVYHAMKLTRKMASELQVEQYLRR